MFFKSETSEWKVDKHLTNIHHARVKSIPEKIVEIGDKKKQKKSFFDSEILTINFFIAIPGQLVRSVISGIFSKYEMFNNES